MKLQIILLALLCIINCERDEKFEIPPVKEKVIAFTLSHTQGSILTWKLKGERAIERGDTIIIYKVEINFFGDDGEITSILTADSGYVLNKTNDLKALGNIQVESMDSTILWTDELNWIEKEQKIITQEIVKYKKGDKLYRGKGMKADPDLKHIIIKEKFYGEGEFE